MAAKRFETRNLTFEGIGLTTLQLEPEAWTLVDTVAKARKQSWKAWANEEVRKMPSDISRAAWIRTRAMAEFYEMALRNSLQATAQERADAIAEGDPFSNPELDSILAFLDEERLREHLSECAVEGSAELGGFNIHVGFDEFQRRCFWIENQMKDALSVVISIPADEPKK
jgi:hypothetical protein